MSADGSPTCISVPVEYKKNVEYTADVDINTQFEMREIKSEEQDELNSLTLAYDTTKSYVILFAVHKY